MADQVQAEWERDILWSLEAGVSVEELAASTGLPRETIEALASTIDTTVVLD